MKNLKIGAKLFISFGVVIVFLICTAAAALVSILMVDNQSTRLNTELSPAKNQVWTIRNDILSAQRDMYIVLSTKDANEQKQIFGDIVASANSLKKVVPQLVETYKGDLTAINEFRKVIRDCETYLNDVTQKVLAGDAAGAMSLMKTNFDPAVVKATESALVVFEQIDNETQAAANHTDFLSFLGMGIVAFLAVINVIMAIAITTGTTRSITAPLKKCTGRLDLLAKGDLHSEVPQIRSKDETGELAAATQVVVSNLEQVIKDITGVLNGVAIGDLTIESNAEYLGDLLPVKVAINSILTSLNDTIMNINQASEQVASGSEQVAGGAEVLSQGATEQASSIEELSASINEISGQVKSNATYASDANDLVDRVGEDLSNSNNMMNELIVAMSEISNSSKEIGKIIKTIEDIAFQTNILALNAAVEAARAGAAGKGFAVVADEVRNLANKSSEAAKNTTTLISNSIKYVSNGTKLAGDTATALGSVVKGAAEVVVLVGKIANASNEQASSISQITLGVEQISSVTQTNSATAEQSAAASQELSSQSVLLKRSIGRFRLKGVGANYATKNIDVSNNANFTEKDYSYDDVTIDDSDDYIAFTEVADELLVTGEAPKETKSSVAFKSSVFGNDKY